MTTIRNLLSLFVAFKTLTYGISVTPVEVDINGPVCSLGNQLDSNTEIVSYFVTNGIGTRADITYTGGDGDNTVNYAQLINGKGVLTDGNVGNEMQLTTFDVASPAFMGWDFDSVCPIAICPRSPISEIPITFYFNEVKTVDVVILSTGSLRGIATVDYPQQVTIDGLVYGNPLLSVATMNSIVSLRVQLRERFVGRVLQIIVTPVPNTFMYLSEVQFYQCVPPMPTTSKSKKGKRS